MRKVEAHSAEVTLLTQARLCVRVVDPNKTQNPKFVLNKLYNENNRISDELRPGNSGNDDAKAMVQYGVEGRGAAKDILCVAGDFPSQSL